jgi:SWI/SNF-related matrix-associated actin-dependent regulator of chromatin subfamily D
MVTQKAAKKFSSVIKSLVVEMNDGSEGNLVEWIKTPYSLETDGFEIKRKGDKNLTLKIVIRLDYSPEKFKLSPILQELLHVHTDTKPAIVMALWQYVKVRWIHYCNLD